MQYCLVILCYSHANKACCCCCCCCPSPHCSRAAEKLHFRLIRIHSNVGNSIFLLGLPPLSLASRVVAAERSFPCTTLNKSEGKERMIAVYHQFIKSIELTAS